jgi:hypothetical protein
MHKQFTLTARNGIKYVELSAFQSGSSVLCRHLSSGVGPSQKLQVGTSLDIFVKKSYK